jgi:ferrous iron transport protein A
MTDTVASTASWTDTVASTVSCMPLGQASRGFCGRINAIHVGEDVHGLAAAEIERRLLELGFVEGAEINVLHEGPIGRDPIAVRINGTTIALRRREAMAILVTSSN